MAGLDTLIDVVNTAIESGITDDAGVASLLDAAGLDSSDDTVNVVQQMIDNSVQSIPTVTQNVVQGASSTAGAITSGLGTAATTAAAHPVATGLVIAGLGAAAAYGAIELNQGKTSTQLSSADLNTIVNGNTGTASPCVSTLSASAQAACVGCYTAGMSSQNLITCIDTALTGQVAATNQNSGILGTFASDLSEGLFGTTPGQVTGEIESGLKAAEPWIIGGIAVAGVVAAAYVIHSLRGGKSQLQITT